MVPGGTRRSDPIMITVLFSKLGKNLLVKITGETTVFVNMKHLKNKIFGPHSLLKTIFFMEKKDFCRGSMGVLAHPNKLISNRHKNIELFCLKITK